MIKNLNFCIKFLMEKIEISNIANIIIHILSLILFGIFLSFILSYILRKVEARAQNRYGPLLIIQKEIRKEIGITRFPQPFYDIVKLLYKETIIPSHSIKSIFKYSPLISLILTLSLLPLIYVPILSDYISNIALIPMNLEIIGYIIVLIPIFWVIGAISSGSPWVLIGAKREAKLLFSYEISFISSFFSIAIISGSLRIKDIISLQKIPYLIINPFAASTFLIATFGLLHLKPFDIPEAEQEIVAGIFTEYSGKLLAILELERIILAYITTTLFIDLFLNAGKISFPFIDFLIYLFLTIIIIVLLGLISAILPRYRIDQAVNFYFTLSLILSLISIIWSIFLRISI